MLAHRSHPRYRLIVAANRDEFYARPTAPATYWADQPQILAGRDLEKGGTWLGVTRSGRFAALTNFRDRAQRDPSARSRGLIVSRFLASDDTPLTYLEQLAAETDSYNDFNLLLADENTLYYFSSREHALRPLDPGIYALSNHLLDTPWPKVRRAKTRLETLLAPADEVASEDLFSLLAERSCEPDAILPDTGVGLEWERALSAIFVVTADYGTRSSTLLLLSQDGEMQFFERTYEHGRAHNTERFFLSTVN